MAAPAAPERPSVRRVQLPRELSPTSWRISSVARLRASGGPSDGEQRVESRGLVSWTLSRTPDGALRGTGQVDSFTVRSTLDTAKTAGMTAPLALLLLEAVVDSAVSRVTIRPPLANECDRMETSAASLARELLVRIPDGAVVGSSWRDSTVSLVCRTGVPMAVHTTTRHTLEKLGDDQIIVRRELAMRLEGKGGSAFRALELTGTGTGTQRLDVRASDGTITSLEGNSTLTLQLRETSPPGAPRLQQLVQRVDVRAERVSR